MRKRRIIVNGAAYHICTRINRQEMLFENNQFKMMFLDVVSQAKEKYSFKFRNFCIMGNHVHLDIQPTEKTTISKIMQWILSVFAIRYNKIFGYKGHVWYDRFKSKAIQTLEHFINTFKYISNNPVRAGLVKHPLDFAFSGITFYQKAPHQYKDLLDPPDKVLFSTINDFLIDFNHETNQEVIEEYSFMNKKAGRKNPIIDNN